jgi:hypothetical protein
MKILTPLSSEETDSSSSPVTSEDAFGAVDACARSPRAPAEDVSATSFGDGESALSFGHGTITLSEEKPGVRDSPHRQAGANVDVDDGKGVLEYLVKGDLVFAKDENAVTFGLRATGLGAGGGGVTGRGSLGSLVFNDRD